MAVEVIGTIKPKNGKDFPVVEAADVAMPNGKRLSEFEGGAGEAPTFDLIALGLPTVSVDAGFVGVTCDTAAMRAALDKGAVQFKIRLGNINDGTEYEATILMGSIETGESMFTCSCRVSGNYTVGNTLATDDLAELTVVVVETGVMAVLSHLLHVPMVSQALNGMILQVIDGKWQLVSVADSSIKTYIDDYINEALGGDY